MSGAETSPTHFLVVGDRTLLVVLGDALHNGLADSLILGIKQLGGGGVTRGTNCSQHVNDILVYVVCWLPRLSVPFTLGGGDGPLEQFAMGHTPYQRTLTVNRQVRY